MLPTRRTILLLAAGIPLAAFPSFIGLPGIAIWFTYLALLLMLLLLAALLTQRFSKTSAALSCPDILYVEGQATATLSLVSDLPFMVKAQVRLEVDGAAQLTAITVPPRLEHGENIYVFGVKPLRRGILQFQNAVVRIQDYLGLWAITKKLLLAKTVQMRPNLLGVSKYALRFYSNPEARIGVKIEKYRGEGSEFESLKEYIPGCDIRQMDWKASARKARLVYREFRAEKNHDIVLALDSGQLMAAEFKKLSKLDYAINALLLIAYISIKTGDRVGFLSFANQVHTFLRPTGGVSTVEAISNACVRLSYQFQPTNFVVALEYLLAQQKRRSLIVIFTDFVDATSAEVMKDYLAVAAQRHLILFVSVRDPILDTYLLQSPQTLLQMHEHGACCDMRDERALLFSELQRMGIHWLDLPPDDITTPVLNKYMEIRRKELI